VICLYQHIFPLILTFTSVLDNWKDEWIYSKHPGKEFGKFTHSAGSFYNDAELDKGKYLLFIMPILCEYIH